MTNSTDGFVVWASFAISDCGDQVLSSVEFIEINTFEKLINSIKLNFEWNLGKNLISMIRNNVAIQADSCVMSITLTIIDCN